MVTVYRDISLSLSNATGCTNVNCVSVVSVTIATGRAQFKRMAGIRMASCTAFMALVYLVIGY